jgi:hypothetical protein
MTLQNLLQIGQLKEHEATRAEVQVLLAAVQRNLADAQVSAISLETRFDAAYKAIMQLSLVAQSIGVKSCRATLLNSRLMAEFQGSQGNAGGPPPPGKG